MHVSEDDAGPSFVQREKERQRECVKERKLGQGSKYMAKGALLGGLTNEAVDGLSCDRGGIVSEVVVFKMG